MRSITFYLYNFDVSNYGSDFRSQTVDVGWTPYSLLHVIVIRCLATNGCIKMNGFCSHLRSLWNAKRPRYKSVFSGFAWFCGCHWRNISQIWKWWIPLLYLCVCFVPGSNFSAIQRWRGEIYGGNTNRFIGAFTQENVHIHNSPPYYDLKNHVNLDVLRHNSSEMPPIARAFMEKWLAI